LFLLLWLTVTMLTHKCGCCNCIVLYGEFLEWPKYKLQRPLEKQDELTNS